MLDVTAQQLGSPLDSIDRGAGRRRARRAARHDPVRRADRDRAQRSGLEPPQHALRDLERARRERPPPHRRRAAADRVDADASRRRPAVDELSRRTPHAARHVGPQPLGRRGGVQGRDSPARHALRTERDAGVPDRLRQRRRRAEIRREGLAAALRSAGRRRLLRPPAGRPRPRRRALRVSPDAARAGARLRGHVRSQVVQHPARAAACR